jgi:hypothetical protein
MKIEPSSRKINTLRESTWKIERLHGLFGEADDALGRKHGEICSCIGIAAAATALLAGGADVTT